MLFRLPASRKSGCAPPDRKSADVGMAGPGVREPGEALGLAEARARSVSRE